MNVEEVYLSWETPGPGVSHEADDPPNSAHRHPNKETRTERIRQTEWEGRHILEVVQLKQILKFYVVKSFAMVCPTEHEC